MADSSTEGCTIHCIQPSRTITIDPATFLHVHGLVEAKYALAPQISVNTLWGNISAWLNDERFRLAAAIFGGVGDISDENESSRLDRFNESWCKCLCDVSAFVSLLSLQTYQKSRATDQSHEIIVPCNLYSFLHRNRSAATALNNMR